MESWRLVFREAFAPLVSDKAMQALLTACETDDCRLMQGSTTTPTPLICVQEWPVEAACLVGFCGWQADDLQTVGEVEQFFSKMLYLMDQRLGEPGGCRWLLNWFDDTPRAEMLSELAREIRRELERRETDRDAIADRQRDPFESADISLTVRIAGADVGVLAEAMG